MDGRATHDAPPITEIALSGVMNRRLETCRALSLPAVERGGFGKERDISPVKTRWRLNKIAIFSHFQRGYFRSAPMDAGLAQIRPQGLSQVVNDWMVRPEVEMAPVVLSLGSYPHRLIRSCTLAARHTVNEAMANQCDWNAGVELVRCSTCTILHRL